MNKILIKKVFGSAAVTAVILGASVVSAQVVGTPSGAPVTVTTTQSTTAPSAGTNGATLGTIALAGTGGGTYTINSLPLALTTSNGGSVSNLSNCQLFNTNGAALNTGTNASSTIGGSNTILFDQPLMVTGGQTTNLTVRCNVASGTTAGSMFQFTAGSPVFAPNLMAALNVTSTVAAGTQNAALGIISLDTSRSGSAVNIASIPVTLTVSGGSASNLSNCALHSATNVSTSLNTGANSVNSVNTAGATNFTLDTAANIPANSAQLYVLTCNVSSAMPAGSTITASINPASLQTTAASGGVITPTTPINASGASSPTSGTITVMAPGTSGTGTVVTPGVPNTGMGGDAPTIILVLALSAALVVVGGMYLSRPRTH